MSPVAREALLAALDDGWADPRRIYTESRRAALLLEAARESVAAAIGARPDEVSFCGSGTAAAHLAVLGAHAGPDQSRAAGVVVGAVEHSSILAAAARTRGPVTTIPVDRTGRVDTDAFEVAVRAPGVRLAALQSANHEVATVQPVEAASEACHAAGVPLVMDAAQSVGRTQLPATWDVLTASAHKWGGLQGVGVLAVRRGVRWRSPGPEDDAEGGRVPGGVGLPAVLASALALESALSTAPADSAHLHELIARIRSEVPSRVPDVQVVGDPDQRLPHLVTFSCLYVDGEALVTELDRLGFAVGSGSACSSSTLRPSHVLAAMGVLTHGNIRVSLPRGTTAAAVDAFLDALPEAVAGVRAAAGVLGL